MRKLPGVTAFHSGGVPDGIASRHVMGCSRRGHERERETMLAPLPVPWERRRKQLKTKKTGVSRSRDVLVGPPGFEPRTQGL